MGDVFFSFRGRVVVNVEALNMVESIGNYVKHRRVPVIVPGKYVTFMVPAISGESIAHGYQTVLAEKAQSQGLPVCKLCSRGIFLKSTRYDVIDEAFLKNKLKENLQPISLNEWLGISEERWNEFVKIKKEELKKKKGEERRKLEDRLSKFENLLGYHMEKAIVRDCTVEDIGGFLYAEDKLGDFNITGVKRTSNFYVGYMIPVSEALNNVVIEPQLHTRYALGTPFVKGEEARGQMIYYVELSSAPYTFSFDLDTRYIGRATFFYGKAGEKLVGDDELVKRKIVALEAFADLLIEHMFGAKKTRFLPVIEWESFVVAVSDGVWTVPSPFTEKYVEKAEAKKKVVDRNTSLYVYRSGGGESFEEVLYRAVEDAKKRIMG